MNARWTTPFATLTSIALCTGAFFLGIPSTVQAQQTTYFQPTQRWAQLPLNQRKRLRRGKPIVAQQTRSKRRYFRAQTVVPCRYQKVFAAFYNMKQASKILAGKPKMEKRRKINAETWLIRTKVKVLFSTITTHLRMTFFQSKRKIESILVGRHAHAKQLYTRWDFEPIGQGKTLVTYSTYTSLKNRTFGWLLRKKQPWTMRKTLRNLRRYCKGK